MGPGYTELFFLDEATALAAGHRPCFECQRARAIAFAQAFPGEGRSRVADMDRILHQERQAAKPILNPDSLPDGAMIEWDEAPHLLLRGKAYPWSPTGYGTPRTPPARARVLTPRATLLAIESGYTPTFHPSLG